MLGGSLHHCILAQTLVPHVAPDVSLPVAAAIIMVLGRLQHVLKSLSLKVSLFHPVVAGLFDHDRPHPFFRWFVSPADAAARKGISAERAYFVALLLQGSYRHLCSPC